MVDNLAYVGDELDVFALAKNWKYYWIHKISPYLGNVILEVGVGIGSNTKYFLDVERELWLGIEPDAKMIETLIQQKKSGEYPAWFHFRQGTIADLSEDEYFDSIIYIDVLEHIELHAQELQMAMKHLKPSGYLIVLSPAYQCLYNEFDEAIGHYRRYTRKTLLALEPHELQLVDSFYLDSMGLITSLVNKFFLKSPKPSPQQIQLWDNIIIPVSRLIDRLHGYSFGRSIIATWRKP